MTDATTKQKRTFEETLSRLEEVLAKLERTDCPLEEALELFGEGMELVKDSRIKLADVENKIAILLKESGQIAPFEAEEDR
ncbi:MAG: exodeoxyribonuclease VII small subunit [Clostridiales bacterium]|jgi:exodeoxyribonuclease VII small subunit|nr:exodeoxyribonuclease VII small subunit [Clostridiales bacterium]